MAAGRMATAGGHSYLLISTSLSLAVIAVAAAFTSGGAIGVEAWRVRGEVVKKQRHKNSGGLVRVLRQVAAYGGLGGGVVICCLPWSSDH